MDLEENYFQQVNQLKSNFQTEKEAQRSKNFKLKNDKDLDFMEKSSAAYKLAQDGDFQ